MFSFMEYEKEFKRMLGNFISERLVKKGNTTIEEMNEISRIESAKFFYNEIAIDKFRKYLVERWNDEMLIKLIAKYIDTNIPKSHYKWINKLHENSPSQISFSRNKFMQMGYEYEIKHKGEC